VQLVDPGEQEIPDLDERDARAAAFSPSVVARAT